MNKRMRQITMLCLLGFAIGTASAWVEIHNKEGAGSLSKIEPAAGPSLAGAEIGGPFSLTNQDGIPVSEETYAGDYKLVFFGFTHCPDVCPAGLEKMALALEELGAAADSVQPIFITIDPQRDTPEVMKEYVAMYHPRLVGLTGTPEQLKTVQASYKVYAAKAEGATPETYTMNHSAYIFLMGPGGEPLTMFTAEDSPSDMVKEMKTLMR